MLRVAVAGLIALAVAVPAAAATQFGFTFQVSRGTAEVLAGTGTLTADDGASDGAGGTIYTLTGASGTITPNFASDPAVYTIDDIGSFFGLADNRLTVSAGVVGYTTLGLDFQGGPGALLFDRAAGTASTFEGAYALDSFAITPRADSAVPEAASWAMMVIGFGAVGAAARRPRMGVARRG